MGYETRISDIESLTDFDKFLTEATVYAIEEKDMDRGAVEMKLDSMARIVEGMDKDVAKERVKEYVKLEANTTVDTTMLVDTFERGDVTFEVYRVSTVDGDFWVPAGETPMNLYRTENYTMDEAVDKHEEIQNRGSVAR